MKRKIPILIGLGISLSLNQACTKQPMSSGPEKIATQSGKSGASPGQDGSSTPPRDIQLPVLAAAPAGSVIVSFEGVPVPSSLQPMAMGFALSKAVNTISKSDEIIPVLPLNDEMTVFALELDKYGLANKKDLILGSQYVEQTTIDGKTAYLGDSIIYSMMEPRNYYKITEINSLAGNMEKGAQRIGLRGQDPIKNDIVCVAKSDVANGNDRIMQRLENANGDVFWRTGDYLPLFGGNGAADIALGSGMMPSMDRPIQDFGAGEFIFTKSNGLVGFALSGFGAQRRLDANPSVASTKARGDSYVINGGGCMECHSAGFNAGTYRPCGGSDDPAANYPTASEYQEIIRNDNARYVEALRKTGYGDEIILGTEPINVLIRDFESRKNIQYEFGDALGGIRL